MEENIMTESERRHEAIREATAAAKAKEAALAASTRIAEQVARAGAGDAPGSDPL